MKYMTLKGSCCFCSLAYILSGFGIDTSDREIILRAGLPFIFAYNSLYDTFHTGTQLQTPSHLNLYLYHYGLSSEHHLHSKEAVIEFILKYPRTMTSICLAHGPHAVVFESLKNNKFIFLIRIVLGTVNLTTSPLLEMNF